ncbi:phasin family protein [Pseudoxanthomonas sp. JBR18]|uniref:phasin family protein n=1 Tax=Pseudoxanthomonas sp. JBR18 TaxID=2969308 RepID=UPI0023055E83|nr:phasin family protein [Pseudoxanthomonas sp. JBR18]WCE03442.1 phasin family protein [Pseudoxanthomonas sp. JBR18]
MTTKKTSRKRTQDTAGPSLQAQAELLQQALGESAQQIWLAGVGAFGRAQNEGSRLFDTLVKEGGRFEQRAGAGARQMRDAVEAGLNEARERASGAAGRVGDALKFLEAPTRRELGALIDRIDALNAQLRRHNDAAQATPTPKARASKAPRNAAAGADADAPTARKRARKTAPRTRSASAAPPPGAPPADRSDTP